MKAEIISAYNNEIKNALETLYRLYQKTKFHPKCVVDHIVLNTNCIGEILRCLQNHPSEEVREVFSLFSVDRFYEEAVFCSLVVFSFEELLPYANDIKDVIKKIELQKQEYRTVEECVYLYDVLYGRFQARHTEYNDEAEEALNRYLSEYQLERSVQNINKRKEAVVYDFKATSLGKIWDEYHHNKSKLVEKIVNAEASREDFEEYFRYVIKIEYLDKSYMTESKVDSNDPWLSALYAIIEHKYTPTSGDKVQPYIKYQGDWYYVMRAAVELNKVKDAISYTDFINLLPKDLYRHPSKQALYKKNAWFGNENRKILSDECIKLSGRDEQKFKKGIATAKKFYQLYNEFLRKTNN